MMPSTRPMHPDFSFYLDFKQAPLIALVKDLRAFVLEIYPESNEILYHTHALTTVFSISEKLSDAFCMLPIYTNHVNLGFNKGTLVSDPHKLLVGTGNLIRHIPVMQSTDYRNDQVRQLVRRAADFAIADMNVPAKFSGQTFSKIKR